MKRSAVITLCGAIAAILSLGSGCAYSTDRPFPSGIQTVHVKMLHSREFRRDLEFALSESLAKRIHMDTPYRMADVKTADTVFEGEILEVRNRAIGDDFVTQQPREVAATFVVAYRWKDLRSGKILVERPNFTYTTSYLPSVGETFDTATIRGIDGLAEQIVQTMETPW